MKFSKCIIFMVIYFVLNYIFICLQLHLIGASGNRGATKCEAGPWLTMFYAIFAGFCLLYLIIGLKAKTASRKDVDGIIVGLSLLGFNLFLVFLNSVLLNDSCSSGFLLPLQVALYGLVLLNGATLLFYNRQTAKLQLRKRLTQFFGTLALYVLVFYLLQAVEFYAAELGYYPQIKDNWTFGGFGGGDDQQMNTFKMVIAFLMFSVMPTFFAVAYFLQSSELLDDHRLSLALANLELLMHVFSQILLRNSFSLLLVVVVWSIWKVVSPMPVEEEKEEDEEEKDHQQQQEVEVISTLPKEEPSPSSENPFSDCFLTDEAWQLMQQKKVIRKEEEKQTALLVEGVKSCLFNLYNVKIDIDGKPVYKS